MREQTTMPGLVSGVTIGRALQAAPPATTLWHNMPFLRLNRQRPLPIANLQLQYAPHQEWATPRWLLASRSTTTTVNLAPAAAGTSNTAAARTVPTSPKTTTKEGVSTAVTTHQHSLETLHTIALGLGWAIQQQAKPNKPPAAHTAGGKAVTTTVPFVFERLKTTSGQAVVAAESQSKSSLPALSLPAAATAPLKAWHSANGPELAAPPPPPRPFRPAGTMPVRERRAAVTNRAGDMQTAVAATKPNAFANQPTDQPTTVDSHRPDIGRSTPYSTVSAQQLFSFLPALALANSFTQQERPSGPQDIVVTNKLNGNKSALSAPGLSNGQAQAKMPQPAGPFAVTASHRLAQVTEKIERVVQHKVVETFERHKREQERTQQSAAAAPRQTAVDPTSDEVVRQLLRKMQTLSQEERFRIGRLR